MSVRGSIGLVILAVALLIVGVAIGRLTYAAQIGPEMRELKARAVLLRESERFLTKERDQAVLKASRLQSQASPEPAVPKPAVSAPAVVPDPAPGPEPSPPQSAAAEPAKEGTPSIDKSAAIQKERRDFLREAVASNLIKSHRLSSPDIARVVVTPAFGKLDYDQKNSLIGVVYAYYFQNSDRHNLVILEDSKTNKKVGTFSSRLGGLVLD